MNGYNQVTSYLQPCPHLRHRPLATRSTSSVAGLIVGNVLPDTASTNSLFMNNLVCNSDILMSVVVIRSLVDLERFEKGLDLGRIFYLFNFLREPWGCQKTEKHRKGRVRRKGRRKRGSMKRKNATKEECTFSIICYLSLALEK